MFCEAYERELKDQAAGGEPLDGELRRHLVVCANCAAEWKLEQSLFAAMDLELHQAVNCEVPASLIASVRQRASVNEPQTMWRKPVLAFAVALLLIGGFAVRLALHNSLNGNVTEQKNAVTAASVSREEHSMEARSGDGDPFRTDNSVVMARRSLASARLRRANAMTPAVTQNRDPASLEVLTSPGEALGLEQYMQRLRMRKIQVAGRVEVTNNGPLEIHDVEITKIDLGEMAILPLDGAK